MNTRPVLTIESSANNSKTSPSLKTKDVVAAPLISKIVSPTKINPKPNYSNLKDNKEASKPSLFKKELYELRSIQIKAAVEKRIATYNEHFKIFSKQYPKCFLVQPKPLAVGIDKLLFAEQEEKPMGDRSSKKKIRLFLFWYTASKEYKEALKIEASRIDLQGNEVAKVTLEQLKPALKSPL